MNTKSNGRYRGLKSYPGIRKDINSQKYLASVSVNKKRITKTFDRLDSALKWQNSFSDDPFADLIDGQEQGFKFKDIWEKYKNEHLPTLEKSSQENRLMMAKFFEGLWEMEVGDITPGVINKHLLAKKEIALKIGSRRRTSFNHELKLLKAIFNWYREEVDHTFSNPVMTKHKKVGLIRTERPKEKKLNSEELKLFLMALKERPFWLDFALTQLFIAGRVQEVAGLQKRSVDFRARKLVIKDVAVWTKKTKRFDHLKPVPKNGVIRESYLVDELAMILSRRINQDSTTSPFVFHDGGQPLSYRQIQYNYDWALEKAGLSDRFSGTHILRHSMATLTRFVTGSIDSTQAVTGHKDLRLVQHYAALGGEENKKALLAVSNHMNENGFFQ